MRRVLVLEALEHRWVPAGNGLGMDLPVDVVDILPIRLYEGAEVEPNDHLDEANVLTFYPDNHWFRRLAILPGDGGEVLPDHGFGQTQSAVVSGWIMPMNGMDVDTDNFTFTANAGEEITITLTGIALHDDILPVLLDAAGNPLATATVIDWDEDGLPDAGVIDYTSAAEANLFIQVAGWDKNADGYSDYYLEAVVLRDVCVAETEPNDTREQATPMELEALEPWWNGIRPLTATNAMIGPGTLWNNDLQVGCVSGSLDVGNEHRDVDYFRLDVAAERQITLVVEGDALGTGGRVELQDAEGHTVARAQAHDVDDDGTADWAMLEYFTRVEGSFFLRLGIGEDAEHATGGGYRAAVSVYADPHHEHEVNDRLETANGLAFENGWLWMLDGGPALLAGVDNTVDPAGMRPIREGEVWPLYGYVQGAIDLTRDAADVDFFSFEALAERQIDVDLSGPLTEHGGGVTLLDAQGHELATDRDWSDGIRVSTATLEGGVFYVRVDQIGRVEEEDRRHHNNVDGSLGFWEGFDPTSYTLNVAIQEIPNPVEGQGEREPNDTLEQAQSLDLWVFPTFAPGLELRGAFVDGIAGGPTSDQDVFQIAIHENEHVTIGVQQFSWIEPILMDANGQILPGDHEDGDGLGATSATFIVYDSAGQEIGHSGSNGDAVDFIAPADGAYFIVVSVPADHTDLEHYTLNIHAEQLIHQGPDEQEPNDTFETANVIELESLPFRAIGMDLRGGDVTGIAGGPTNDQDVFQFEVRAGESVRVGVDGLLFVNGAGIEGTIDDWLAANGLNEFGDALDTMYLGGTPLFDELTGETIDRFTYIIENHPELGDLLFGGGVDLVVYDAAGTEIGRSSDERGDLHGVSFDAPAAGTYFVVVAAPADAGQPVPVGYHLGVLAQTANVELLMAATADDAFVLMLDSGDTFDFTDASGDLVHIRYRGNGEATITFTGPAADGSDIATVVVEGSRRGDLLIETDGSVDVGCIEINGIQRRHRTVGGFGRLHVDGDVSMLLSEVNLRRVDIEGMLGDLDAAGRRIDRLDAGVFDAALAEVARIRSLHIDQDVIDMMFADFMDGDVLNH